MILGAHTQHHLDSLVTAWQRLRAQPLASAFSILVIGIALSLPTGLYLLISNLDRASSSLSEHTEMTVFLKPKIETAAALGLAEALRNEPGIRKLRFVSREDALLELQRSGLDDVLTSLSSNPLPHALVIEPTQVHPEHIRRLGQQLRQRPEVDTIASAEAWAHRLAALLDFGVGLTWMLGTVLALSLAAITGNTIRLQIYARRDEIEISRLIGATDRFIRRPFLYFGALQGLLGGLAALILSGLAILWLNQSVAELASTYGSSFRLAHLDAPISLLLLACGALLGLAGAWLSVAYTLRDFD